MNVICGCRQLATAAFDTVLGGSLDSVGRTAFQQLQTCTVNKKTMAGVAGRDKVCVPAASVATIGVKGHLRNTDENIPLITEPAYMPLTPGIAVLSTLVDSKSHILQSR